MMTVKLRPLSQRNYMKLGPGQSNLPNVRALHLDVLQTVCH